ncbi:hypothetical protein B0T24DRAFT_389286 [Lasiosphaeria ovina]|uniref:Uncharacterized protein n=1 Tax=Lasiosphaeria ovina TaxID=92902 RepID=A0AAE0JZM8_9PEZI|nr:hypothetical protein B0T24DRAFT_389286 [Lasiosphaeria ovina]
MAKCRRDGYEPCPRVKHEAASPSSTTPQKRRRSAPMPPHRTRRITRAYALKLSQEAKTKNQPSPQPERKPCLTAPSVAQDNNIAPHPQRAFPPGFHEWSQKADNELMENDWDTGFAVWARGPVDRTTWDALSLAVTQFAASLVKHTPPFWSNLDEETRWIITRWAPKAKEYWEGKPLGKQLLVEAWVWRVLIDSLFSPNCVAKWSSSTAPAWQAYGKLRHGLRHHATADNAVFTECYHRIRWLMVRLLFAVDGNHVPRAALSKALRDELWPLVVDTTDDSLSDLITREPSTWIWPSRRTRPTSPSRCPALTPYWVAASLSSAATARVP